MHNQTVGSSAHLSGIPYEHLMLRANKLAEKGLGLTAPNPIVGALIVNESGAEISSGFHAGGDHAEIVAINEARKNGIIDFSNCTLIVTLEPCNHFGKTPPCSQAIIDSGIKRVVFALSDPNEAAAGGAAKLRAANIEVISDVQARYVTFTNRAWLKKVTKSKPWIVSKVAATIDGKIAASDGSSKWITEQGARSDVARLRFESDAILTSTGTVLADDSHLVPRFANESHGAKRSGNPTRVVMGHREVPPSFKINDDAAETIFLRTHDFAELLDLAIDAGWNQILVEAGSEFNSALIKADLVDELLIYFAPTTLGLGKSFLSDLGISTLAERKDFSFGEISRVGRDLRIQMFSNSSTYSEIFEKTTNLEEAR